ncbi:MAG: glucose-6-phosphate isomerase, partial [Boseongicola sp.]
MDWTRLEKAAAAAVKTPLLDLFADKDRAKNFSVTAGDLLFDYSKTAMGNDARALLIEMLHEAGFSKHRDAMFAGEEINETEGRAVLHTALRNIDGEPVNVDGVDVMPAVMESIS